MINITNRIKGDTRVNQNQYCQYFTMIKMQVQFLYSLIMSRLKKFSERSKKKFEPPQKNPSCRLHQMTDKYVFASNQDSLTLQCLLAIKRFLSHNNQIKTLLLMMRLVIKFVLISQGNRGHFNFLTLLSASFSYRLVLKSDQKAESFLPSLTDRFVHYSQGQYWHNQKISLWRP